MENQKFDAMSSIKCAINAQNNSILPNVGNYNKRLVYEFNSGLYDLNKIFHRFLANRVHKADHIKNMEKAILEAQSMEYFPPIEVDINTFIIIDGNGRFEALMNLIKSGRLDNVTLLVLFKDIQKDELIKYIIDRNTTSISWKGTDYVRSFAKSNERMGSPYINFKTDGYKKLVEFCESVDFLHTNNKNAEGEIEIKPRYGCRVLNAKNSDVIKGTLEISDEQIKKGYVTASQISKINYAMHSSISSKDGHVVVKTGGGWFESFIAAFVDLKKDFGDDDKFNDYIYAMSKYIGKKSNRGEIPFSSTNKKDWLIYLRAVIYKVEHPSDKD